LVCFGAQFGALVAGGTPVSTWMRHGAFDRTLQRLLANEAGALSLFGQNPFGDRPPPLGRVSAYALTPTTPTELRAS
jgi:hypothetical protein